MKMSKQIAVHRSTIYRELKRNHGHRGYRPLQANQKAVERKKNASKNKRFTCKLKECVSKLLKDDFSPEQVSGHLLKHDDIRISHETIYQFIWSEKASGGTLYKHLFAVRQKRNESGMVAVTGEVKFLTESALKSVPGLLKPKNELVIGKSTRLLAKIINAL